MLHRSIAQIYCPYAIQQQRCLALVVSSTSLVDLSPEPQGSGLFFCRFLLLCNPPIIIGPARTMP